MKKTMLNPLGHDSRCGGRTVPTLPGHFSEKACKTSGKEESRKKALAGRGQEPIWKISVYMKALLITLSAFKVARRSMQAPNTFLTLAIIVALLSPPFAHAQYWSGLVGIGSGITLENFTEDFSCQSSSFGPFQTNVSTFDAQQGFQFYTSADINSDINNSNSNTD